MNIISLNIFSKTDRLQNEIDSLEQKIKEKNKEKELQAKKEIEDIEKEIKKNEILLQGKYSCLSYIIQWLRVGKSNQKDMNYSQKKCYCYTWFIIYFFFVYPIPTM